MDIARVSRFFNTPIHTLMQYDAPTYNQMYKSMRALEAEETIKLNSISLYSNMTKESRIEINDSLKDKLQIKKAISTKEEIADFFRQG